VLYPSHLYTDVPILPEVVCAVEKHFDQDAVLTMCWSPTIVRVPWTTTIVVHSPYECSDWMFRLEVGCRRVLVKPGAQHRTLQIAKVEQPGYGLPRTGGQAKAMAVNPPYLEPSSLTVGMISPHEHDVAFRIVSGRLSVFVWS
jgi:hypothetical protein